MEISKLNHKHRLFVEAFLGDPLQAMRIAGFEGSDTILEKQGNDLLKQPLIVEAIRQRSLYQNSTAKIIATREERQAFWTSLMRNDDPHHKPEINDKGVTKPIENLPLPIRIKASELLGKSETDFVERIDMTNTLTITDLVQDSYSIKFDDLNAIEAQYEHARQIKNKAILAPFKPTEETQTENENEGALDEWI